MTTKKKNGKALATQEANAVDIKGRVEGVTAGFENVDAEDIILPRLALVQNMSAAVSNGDAKPGQFMNTVSMETFKPPVEVIPVYYSKAAIYFPEKINDPIICMSRDSKIGNTYDNCKDCEFSWMKWVDNKPPACDAVHNFACILSGDDPTPDNVFVVSLRSTSAKAGKKWLTTAMYQANGKEKTPIFGIKYNLNVVLKENAKGKFFIFDVKPMGKVENYPDYEDLYNMIGGAYSEGRVSTDESTPDVDGFDPDSM